MPAMKMASSGVPARSAFKIDVCGSCVAMVATLARSASRSAFSEARGGPAARSRSSSASSVALASPTQPGGVRVIAADLLGVHVEMDDALARLERHQREATPHGQDHVGGVEVPVQRRLAPEGGAEGEVARVAHRALALGRLDDARLQVLGDGGQRGIGAREMDAAARVDHGVLGGEQHLGGAVDVARRARPRGGTRRRAGARPRPRPPWSRATARSRPAAAGPS